MSFGVCRNESSEFITHCFVWCSLDVRCSKRVQCGTLSDVRAVCCFVLCVCALLFFLLSFLVAFSLVSRTTARTQGTHSNTFSNVSTIHHLQFLARSSYGPSMDHRKELRVTIRRGKNDWLALHAAHKRTRRTHCDLWSIHWFICLFSDLIFLLSDDLYLLSSIYVLTYDLSFGIYYKFDE